MKRPKTITKAALPKTKRRRRGTGSLNIAKLVDRFFAEMITVKNGDQTRRMTRFEAICWQLFAKASAGQRRAEKVFLKYVQFAASQKGAGGYRFKFGEKGRLQ